MIGPVLDFDSGADWLPSLHAHLVPVLPGDFAERIASITPEGPVDIRIALTDLADKPAVIEAVRTWISARDVLIYHGTRINEAQRASILRDGLLPLAPSERAHAIADFLGQHQRWPEIEARVPEAIDWVCRHSGSRDGKVYGLLSRSGLVRGCNHYLVEGSEFDHHVANHLLGEECHDENRRRGVGSVVQFRVSGIAALAAANPHGEMGDTPNLIAELVGALGWWLVTGDNDTKALEEGCGVVFYKAIPPDTIESIITISDDELWEHYDHRLR